MGMKICFLDDCIFLGALPCRSLTLGEGQSVFIRYMGATYWGGRLQWQDGELSAPAFVQYRFAHCILLRFSPAISSCRVLAQQSLGYGSYTVSVLSEPDRTTVWLEGSQSYCTYLPPLRDAAICYSATLRAVAVFGALCAAQDENPLYGCLCSLQGEVLFAGAGAEFSLQDQWVATCAYADMRRHTRTTQYGYRDGVFCTLAHTFACKSAHTYIPKLRPFLFAEALAIQDTQEALSYLSPSLRTDWSALSSYLGPVASVISPPYLLPDDQVAWVDADGQGKRFAFTLQDDLIDDICRVDV